MMRLSVFSDQSSLGQYDLIRGKQSVGSAATCDIVIAHPEVNALATMVEVSGSAVFVENKNQYPIYVGQQLVDVGGMAEWPVGATIGLTRSVTLELADTTSVSVDAIEKGSAQDKTIQNAVQVVVIAVCAILCFYMLANDKGSSVSTTGSEVRFDELVQRYEAAGGSELKNLSHGHRVLLGYLTEARNIERRWGRSKSDEAREAYEIILRYHLVGANNASDSLVDETRQFASSRIAGLR
ncbi:FHA domain-containing protein [Neorhodopirellula pilleata]|uniref:Uncharacterized protein n=1 Tax=Neorhodopirellula pilleata TaxID=2714738 RepID=A0A5C6AUN0_9BACT|nr:hypothetical protein [Neorhodopirellula pilleata]TWU03705.1 hypothetical protein Pla100_06350 [Neorhodopirellula pilleata]